MQIMVVFYTNELGVGITARHLSWSRHRAGPGGSSVVATKMQVLPSRSSTYHIFILGSMLIMYMIHRMNI